MSVVAKLFSAHPASVNETYVQHLSSASYFGLRMVVAGIACLVHALLPFMFSATGREAITELHKQMVTHRERDSV